MNSANQYEEIPLNSPASSQPSLSSGSTDSESGGPPCPEILNNSKEEKIKRRKFEKKTRIFIIILIILVVVVGIFAVWSFFRSDSSDVVTKSQFDDLVKKVFGEQKSGRVGINISWTSSLDFEVL